jgi:nucleoside-diphosphate-sugar epimerase
MTTRIAVIGATRGIGAALVHYARAAGHEVTAVGRSLSDDEAPGFTPIKASILDPGVADRAVAGAGAVVWCAGSVGFGPAFLKDVRWLSEGTSLIVDAMKRAGVRRLVVVTGIGAGDSRGHGGFVHDRLLQPLAIGAIYRDKDRQEEIVRASGLDWTIVRPGFLTDEPPERRYRIVTDLAGVRVGYISRSDCADCLLRAVETNSWIGETILITD